MFDIGNYLQGIRQQWRPQAGYGNLQLRPEGFNLQEGTSSLMEDEEIPDAASGAQGNKPWGGLLGPDTKWGKKIGDFGKKGGLLGMAMKGMGVEGAGGIMGQFTGAMSGMLGGGQQSVPQQDYTSEVQNAANLAPPSYQRQQGSFY